jgi:dipeptidyl aminopeptidase/acylaminoacyl peptidase
MSQRGRALASTVVTIAVGALVGASATPVADARPGGTLVFSLDDSLWQLPVHATRAYRIPSPPLARDREPALAPTGSLLAFTRFTSGDTAARVLVRSPADRSAREIAAGSAPAFSPTSAELAFQTTAGLQAADLATGTVRPLTQDPSDRDPAWSRDNVLAFARGPNGRDGVLAIAPGGIDPQRIVWSSRADIGIVRPEWSPDGRRLVVTLAYAGAVPLRRPLASRLCTAGIRSLQTAPGTEVRLALCRGYAAWSPDGSALAVQSDSRLRLFSTRGRPLGAFCRVGSVARGLAWGLGRIAPASRSSRRLGTCSSQSLPDPGEPATGSTSYCFRVGSGNRRRLRCVPV